MNKEKEIKKITKKLAQIESGKFPLDKESKKFLEERLKELKGE